MSLFKKYNEMEVINSFFNNIKDKLTNPFFGTLIIVLLVHHWELIYGIFNFDKDCLYDEKILFIKNYISNNITLTTFVFDAFQALIYMFLGYLIIVFTRSLVLWVEFWLMPFITGKVVNKNVVKRNLYDEVLNENKKYFDEYEDQRENVRKFSKIIDEQVEQINEKDKLLLKQSDDISNTIATLESTQSDLYLVQELNEGNGTTIRKLNRSIKEYIEQEEFYAKNLSLYRDLFFDNQSKGFYSSIDKFPPIILDKSLELKKDNKLKDFLSLGLFLTENSTQVKPEILIEMIKRGFLIRNRGREEFTPIGRIIFKYKDILLVN